MMGLSPSGPLLWERGGRNGDRAEPSSSAGSVQSVRSARRRRKGQDMVTANQEFSIKFGKPIPNKSQRCRVHCCGRGSCKTRCAQESMAEGWVSTGEGCTEPKQREETS